MFSWWSPTKARETLKFYLLENIKQSLEYKIAYEKVVADYEKLGVSENNIPKNILQEKMNLFLEQQRKSIELQINASIEEVCEKAIPKHADCLLNGIKNIFNYGIFTLIFIPAIYVLLSIDIKKEEWSGLDIGVYWVSIIMLTTLLVVSIWSFYVDIKKK